MSRFLDTRGRTTQGIGLCDRCKRKFPLGQLRPDPNSPGLRVCDADRDELDPYRLAQRPADRIALPFHRPDTPVSETSDLTSDWLTYLEDR